MNDRDRAYFEHHYVSNSNLKALHARLNPSSRPMDPTRLEEIFEFGHLVEDLIFQPHQANMKHKDIEQAKEMNRIFRADPICRQILWVPDLRRQHEFYRADRYGVPARCKTDADSRVLSLVFELKGLAVKSESQFEEAIRYLDYDMGIAWYMDVTNYKRALLAAPSKLVPKLFKRLVTSDNPIYRSGHDKVLRHVKQWIEMFPEEYGKKGNCSIDLLN